MGGAGSKPGQVPARRLKTLKGRAKVSVPNDAQDTTLHAIHKNTKWEETTDNQNDQQLCCNEETCDKNIINSPDVIPLETKHSDSSKILLESISAKTEKLEKYVDNNFLGDNALYYQYTDNTQMLSECPLTHVRESYSRCQILQLMKPNIQFESATNMLPKCSSFDALDACRNDHSALLTVHKNETKVKSQNDDSKLFEFSPSQRRIKRNKPKKLSNTALNSASSNSLASSPGRPVRCSECNARRQPFPKSVSFSNFEKTPYLPVKRNRSLKLPTKSVTFDLTHTRWSGPVPSRRNLKPLSGVASTGVLKRRNSLPGTNQPTPLKSCLKLPMQDSFDSIPEKPCRSHTGPLNSRDAKNWIIYYKHYLDALKVVPGMSGPSFHEGRNIRSPVLERRENSEFQNPFGSNVNSSSNVPWGVSGSTNIGDILPESGLTCFDFKSAQAINKPSQPVLKRNSNRNIKENQKLEQEPPVGSFVVVEMDERGYTINRSEGEKKVDVRRLGKDWRALKGGPTHIMDMLMRQRSRLNMKATKKKASKKDLERDSGKSHREGSRGSHRKNLKGGLYRHGEEGRNRRRKERRRNGHKDSTDDCHRDRHRHVQRARSKSRGEERRIAKFESEREVSRVQKGHGEGFREECNKDNEDHRDTRRKIQEEYYRKIPREVKRDHHRKSRKENYSGGRSEGRHGEDNREEQKEKHRDVYVERNRDEQRDNGHKRHKEKERFNLNGKERGERFLEDKTSEHATYNRERLDSFYLQKIRQAESMSKKTKKEGRNSESDISDSSIASADDTKDSRRKKKKNRRKDSVSRKKNMGDY